MRRLLFVVLLAACAETAPASAPAHPPQPSVPIVAPSSSPASASASSVPVAAPPMTPPAPVAVRIAAAGDATCALLADKTVRCWGDRGLLGNVPMMHRENPKPMLLPAPATATQLVLGASHGCILHEDGMMSCWGSNYAGELGLGKPTSPPGPSIDKPTPVPGVQNVTSISIGSHTSALLADKTVMFWGDYDSGNGDPRPAGSAKPAVIAGVRDAVEIADGHMGSCARLASGAVKCWYDVSPGRIPRGKDRVDPVVAPVRDAVALYASDTSLCAVTRAGKLVCWAVLSQQIVDPHPAFANAADFAELAFGSSTSCARKKNGQVVCEDDKGALRAVEGLSSVTQIAVGSGHACALQDGKVLCWGDNAFGQLGDGTTKARKKPVAVVW